MLSVDRIQANLQTVLLGHHSTCYPETGSTNDDLWALYDNGHAQPGHLLLTDRQVSGKGRQGRHWISDSESSLTFSLLLDGPSSLADLGLDALVAGIAVVEATHEFGVPCKLKWPNDIVAEGRKVGGILCESRTHNDGALLVVGIGLNVNQRANDFTEKLAETASSIYLLSGNDINREDLVAATLNHMEPLLKAEPSEIISLWMDRCAHVNRSVSFHQAGSLIHGTFIGLNEIGHAMISIEGEVQLLSGGDLVIHQ